MVRATGPASDVDVIVIGAGAAGLAAARALKTAGRSFKVLEAMSRRGGRAFTDTTSLGVPFDMGCHWLHSASINPFSTYADELGHRYLKRGTRRSVGLHVGSAWADDATTKVAWDVVEQAFEDVDQAGERGQSGTDCSAQEVIRATPPWSRLVRHWFGLLSAAPPEDLSVVDLARYRDTRENWPVVDGYGALVDRVFADIPVELNCPVTEIDWHARPLRVTTPQGLLTAQAVIVTASTNALLSGQISFTPSLPDSCVDAALGCPTGHAEKVAFLLDAPLPDTDPSSYIDTIDMNAPDRPPINFTLNAVGTPVIIGQLGGHVARDLEAAGEAAMIDFAEHALRDVFGADLLTKVTKRLVTRWASEPTILGAYSYARPGKADLRRNLMEPMGERLFLAGEATSPDFFSTAHGAYQSGKRAADQALKVLAG